MSLKVIVLIVVKQKETKDLVYCVDSIKRPDDEIRYKIPKQFQPAKYHAALFELPIVRTAIKNMTKAGHYRNLRLTLTGPLVTKYADGDGNFVFEEFYLEETTEDTRTASEEATLSQNSIKSSREDILRNIEKKFSIEKFKGKQKPEDWIETFETECVRYEVQEDVLKVKCLRLFLQERALDWYDALAMKNTKDDWRAWETSFKKVFAAKGWSQVRYAYSFRFMTGSLIEYALRKEKLVLEVESRMTEISRINLIVMGLPIYIQDKLDREAKKSTDELINKLGQYETNDKPKSVNKKYDGDIKTGEQRGSRSNSEKQFVKRPCSICESLGYRNRFHPLDKCRNRNEQLQSERKNDQMRVNWTEDTMPKEARDIMEQDEKN